MTINRKWGIWAGGLTLGIIVALSLWPKKQDDRYTVEKATKGDISQTVNASGPVNPVTTVNVGTQVSGTINRLYVDFNSKVKRGQVLAELDTRNLANQLASSTASVASAQAALALAQSNHSRIELLRKSDYASVQELDQVRQALDAAKAAVSVAHANAARDKVNFDNARIVSPIDGVVVSRAVDAGQTVAANFQTPTLFSIAQDLSAMEIYASFAEADIGSVKEGTPVSFRVDAYPDRRFKGKVKQLRLNPATQSNVVTYVVVISVDNSEGTLLPGMTANVAMVVAERKGVLRVPVAALRFSPEGTKVKSRESTLYVLRNGKLEKISVKTGITDNRYVEIKEGLAEETEVVVDEVKVKTAESGPVRMRMF